MLPAFNPHSAIQNKNSRAKQRGTSEKLEVGGLVRRELTELFSGLFYVAASRLNSPRFSLVLIRRSPDCVKLLGREQCPHLTNTLRVKLKSRHHPRGD